MAHTASGEDGGLWLGRGPRAEPDGHLQRRVLAGDVDTVHLDDVAEPLLQRALHEELRGRREFVTARLEDQPHNPAAERRPVDALSRRGEQHLLDQVAHPLLVGRLRSAPPRVDRVGVVQVHGQASLGAHLRDQHGQRRPGGGAYGGAVPQQGRHPVHQHAQRADDPRRGDARAGRRRHERAASHQPRRRLCHGRLPADKDTRVGHGRLRLTAVGADHARSEVQQEAGHQITSRAPLLSDTLAGVSFMLTAPLVSSIPEGSG